MLKALSLAVALAAAFGTTASAHAAIIVTEFSTTIDLDGVTLSPASVFPTTPVGGQSIEVWFTYDSDTGVENDAGGFLFQLLESRVSVNGIEILRNSDATLRTSSSEGMNWFKWSSEGSSASGVSTLTYIDYRTIGSSAIDVFPTAFPGEDSFEGVFYLNVFGETGSACTDITSTDITATGPIDITSSASVSPTPEPASLAIWGLGGIGLLISSTYRRLKRR